MSHLRLSLRARARAGKGFSSHLLPLKGQQIDSGALQAGARNPSRPPGRGQEALRALRGPGAAYPDVSLPSSSESTLSARSGRSAAARQSPSGAPRTRPGERALAEPLPPDGPWAANQSAVKPPCTNHAILPPLVQARTGLRWLSDRWTAVAIVESWRLVTDVVRAAPGFRLSQSRRRRLSREHRLPAGS